MKVAINKFVRGKPKSMADHTSLTFKNVNTDITAKELSEYVKKGFSFCSQHKNNHRKKSNFLVSTFISVDIDKGMTINEAINDQFITNYSSFIYTTENHAIGFDRFRIVFELQSDITDSEVMKNALSGVIKKFGGDKACKDACRLFYGSKDCDIYFQGNILPNEELEDLILLGKEVNVESKKENSTSTENSTIRSIKTLNQEATVRDTNGLEHRIIDLPSGTPVHCPVHIDNNASAFTLSSKKNVAGVHCTTCNRTYFTSSNIPLYDFNYSLSNLDNLGQDDILITDNEEYFTLTDSSIIKLNERYLPEHETDIPLVFVKSPKGSGKTQWLESIVKKLKENNVSILLIGHRRSLITSVSKRLQLTPYINYTSVDRNGNQIDKITPNIPSNHYAISIDSLSIQLDPKTHKYDYVLIDEVEQVFSHLAGETVKDKRNETYYFLKHYINNAKQTFVMDADLNYLTIDSLCGFVSSTEKEVKFIHNTYEDNKRDISLYDSEDHLINELMKSIENKERCFVCSNSKTQVNKLTEYINNVYGEKCKTISITGDNSNNSDIQDIIQNIKTRILDYDVMIVSPSLGTGVNITFPHNQEKIDTVYGFFKSRINTHFDIDQQLSRVRHPKKVKVWISPETFRFETDQDVIKQEARSTNKCSLQILGIDDDGNIKYNENDGYMDLYANVISIQRGSKNHLKSHFINMKEYNGCKIISVSVNSNDSKEGLAIMKIAKELQEKQRIKNITNAHVITKDEYIELHNVSDKYSLLDTHINAMRRYEIESFYYLDVDTDLVTNDKDGNYRNCIREYESYIDDDSNIMAKDISDITNNHSHISDRKSLLERKKFFIEIFKSVGLLDKDAGLICDKQIHKDDLLDFIQHIKTNRVKIQRWFNIDVRKDIEIKPIQQLGVFIKFFGLTWNRRSKKTCGDGKDYYYWIPSEQIEYLEEITNRRSDSLLTEKWHLDRQNIKDNRLFKSTDDLKSLILDQIANPELIDNDWVSETETQ